MNMETINFTWVNLLKKYYLDVLDLYQSNPKLLEDSLIASAYNVLLSVNSVEDFHQWRKLMKDWGLAMTETEDIERSRNNLAVLDDFAEGASDDTIRKFIEWKLSFDPLKWQEITDWNKKITEILYTATKRDDDMDIIIFPCGEGKTRRWAAIGQDADRLFEIFGWQTGYVDTNGDFVSWMFISEYGFEVLMNSGYSIKVKDFGEFDIVSIAFQEDATASLQQFIDYLRMMDSLTIEQVKFLKKIRPIISPHPGYWELTHGVICFNEEEVYVKKVGGGTITLAQGKNWRLDELTGPLVAQMGAEIGEA